MSEKYKNRDLANILSRKTTIISILLQWLEQHISDTEIIDIHEWANERYYIVVEDTRTGWKHPAEARIGFTVNVDDDDIIWNTPTEVYPFGGNCFVRTNKWKNLIKCYLGDDITKIKKNVHWYQNIYLNDEWNKGGLYVRPK